MILVTGCSSGIGVETARALLTTAAHVFITARDIAKGQKVLAELRASGSNGVGQVDLLHLNLDSLESVRACAKDFLSKSKQLNILITNAGKLDLSKACCCGACSLQYVIPDCAVCCAPKFVFQITLCLDVVMAMPHVHEQLPVPM